MKIALPKEYLGEGVQPGVKEAILKAADTYRSLGATVEEVSLPHSKYGVAVYYIIASSEASSNLQRFDGIRYGYRSENVKDGRRLCELAVKVSATVQTSDYVGNLLLVCRLLRCVL